MKFDEPLLAEIKARRKYLIEIGVVAIYLGLFVNIGSSYVVELMKANPFLNLLIPPFLIAAPFYVLVRYIYGRSLIQHDLSLLLPLSIVDNEPTILSIKGYSPSSRAHDLLRAIKGNPTINEELLRDWQSIRDDQAAPENAAFRTRIAGMAVALIISLIKLYSEHTLSTSSLYHKEYGQHAWMFKASKIRTKDLLKGTEENVFIRMENLKLPEAMTLSVKQDRKTDSICIESPFALIHFRILPYWKKISETNNRKAYRIVTRNINAQQISILMIPVTVTIAIKFRKVFSKQIEPTYSWMQGLMIDAIRWLAWEEYEKNDPERLIVEIHRRLEEVQRSLERT